MGEDGGGLIGCAVSVWEFMSAGRKKKGCAESACCVGVDLDPD